MKCADFKREAALEYAKVIQYILMGILMKQGIFSSHVTLINVSILLNCFCGHLNWNLFHCLVLSLVFVNFNLFSWPAPAIRQNQTHHYFILLFCLHYKVVSVVLCIHINLIQVVFLKINMKPPLQLQ